MDASPYLCAGDGSRLLVALPRAATAHWSLKGSSRLFYADDTILSDIAHVGIWDYRREELPKWMVGFESNAPVGLFDRTSMQKIEPLVSNSVLPGGKVLHSKHAPYAAQRRLAHACVDAWLSQSDSSWSSYAEAPDRLKALLVPAAMVSVNWTLGGSVMSSRLEALASLDLQIGGKPNPLSFMFDEARDGIERPNYFNVSTVARACQTIVSYTAMRLRRRLHIAHKVKRRKDRIYWRFDPLTRDLVNVLSGQHLRLQERIDRAKTSNRPSASGGRIWRFQYEDSEFSYPLVVFSKALPSRGNLQFVWVVDHERSKALWGKRVDAICRPSAFGSG